MHKPSVRHPAVNWSDPGLVDTSTPLLLVDAQRRISSTYAAHKTYVLYAPASFNVGRSANVFRRVSYFPQTHRFVAILIHAVCLESMLAIRSGISRHFARRLRVCEAGLASGRTMRIAAELWSRRDAATDPRAPPMNGSSLLSSLQPIVALVLCTRHSLVFLMIAPTCRERPASSI